jgi:hypothetical protein
MKDFFATKNTLLAHDTHYLYLYESYARCDMAVFNRVYFFLEPHHMASR